MKNTSSTTPTGIVGFYGASNMDRLPVEPAIRDRVEEFGQLRFRKARVS